MRPKKFHRARSAHPPSPGAGARARLFTLSVVTPVVALVLSMLTAAPAHAAGTMTATGSSLAWGYRYPGNTSLGTAAAWEAPTVGQATTFTGLPYSNQQRLRVPATVQERLWKIDGTLVSTAATYTPTAADRGKMLSLEVRYSYTDHTDFWWRPGAWTVRNPPLRGKVGQFVGISGEQKVGRTVTYPALHISPTPETYSVTWSSVDYNVPGPRATVTTLAEQRFPYGQSTSFTIPPAAAGLVLQACVVGGLAGHEDYRWCAQQNTKTVAPGDMTINHTVTGNLDGGSRTLSVTGADAYPDANVEIVWTADGEIVPARATSSTSSTLDYAPELRGKDLKATYTVTAPGYRTVTRTVDQPRLEPYGLPQGLQVEQMWPLGDADSDRAGRSFGIAVRGLLDGWDVRHRWTIDGTVVSTSYTYLSGLADAGKQLTYDLVVSRPGHETFTYQKVFTVAGPAAPSLTGQVDGDWVAGRTVSATADTSFYAYSDLNPPRFEWQVDGVTVAGQVQRTLELTRAMVGSTVRVRAHYSNADSHTSVSPWARVEPIQLPVSTSWRVSAPATARAGEPVEIAIAGVAGSDTVEVTWRSGSATGAVLASGASPRFTPPVSLGGTRLHATVTLSAADVRTRVDSFSWDLPLLDLPPITASTVGEPVVGEMVGLALDGLQPDFATDYTWYADGDLIDGADGAELPITEAMRDAVISVRYSVSAPGYRPSTGTHVIGRVPFVALVAPFARLAASSPEPGVGRELTAEAGSETAGTTVAWEWRRGGEVVSTSATYTPQIQDAGQRLTVAALLTAPDHEPVTLVFEVAVPLMEITGATVALSGLAAVGHELGAEVVGAPTDASVSYAWKRGQRVVGAGPTYTATRADIGSAITVEATVSASGYAPVTVTATSATIAAPGSGPNAADRPKVVLAKKSVKSRTRQTVKVLNLAPGQRVRVRVDGARIAAFRLTATEALKVTKRAKVNGAKVRVTKTRPGVVAVKFKVGTAVKVKTKGLTPKERKKAKARAARKNTKTVLVTGTGGLSKRLSYRIR